MSLHEIDLMMLEKLKRIDELEKENTELKTRIKIALEYINEAYTFQNSPISSRATIDLKEILLKGKEGS
jgi:cell shape-determining protein MreC